MNGDRYVTVVDRRIDLKPMDSMQLAIVDLERQEAQAAAAVDPDDAGRIWYEFFIKQLGFALSLIEKPEDVTYVRDMMRLGKVDIKIVPQLISGKDAVPDDAEAPRPAKKTASRSRVRKD